MELEQKKVTIDIGLSWTKLFLVGITKDNLIRIEKSAKLPTSNPTPLFAINLLLSEIKDNLPKIIVSKQDHKKVAGELKAEFVFEEDAKKELANFFKTSDSQTVILDAGASGYENIPSVAEVGKFLTFNINELALENFLGNKFARPNQLPVDVKELEIEESYTRAILGEQLKAKDVKKQLVLVLTGGGLSGTPSISRLCFLVLNLLQAREAAKVYFDREFFLPSFGALLAVEKKYNFADTSNWLDNLGTFISIGGRKQVSLDWGFSQVQEVELAEDEIIAIPAEFDQRVDVTIFDSSEKVKLLASGGSVGLLLDGRSKPLDLVFGQEASRKKIVKWLQMLEKADIAKEVF